tara:strand:+ start:362 stop:520 length:159 start_codon:yes stop_codon:yes gene_type:complete
MEFIIPDENGGNSSNRYDLTNTAVSDVSVTEIANRLTTTLNHWAWGLLLFDF